MAKKERFFPLNAVGGRIQRKRHELNLSRSEFYDLIFENSIENGSAGSNSSKEKTVYNWESEKTELNYSTILSVCKILKCSSDYLLGLDECTTKTQQFISEETGLSENSIDTLKRINNYWDDKEKNTLNYILENSDRMLDFLKWLSIYTKNDFDTPITFNEKRGIYEKCGYSVNGENGIILGEEVIDNAENPGWNQIGIGVDILESHAMLQMQEIMIEWKNKRKSK